MTIFIRGKRRPRGDDVEVEYLAGLSEITTPLSSDEILGINSEPPVVVPAVPGKVILPMAFRFVSHSGSTPYVVTQEPSLNIVNAYWGELPIPQSIGELLRSSFDQMTPWIPANPTPGFSSAVVHDRADMENYPLTMIALASPTEGDGALDVIVMYDLV